MSLSGEFFLKRKYQFEFDTRRVYFKNTDYHRITDCISIFFTFLRDPPNLNGNYFILIKINLNSSQISKGQRKPSSKKCSLSFNNGEI